MSAVEDVEFPFALPVGWEYTRLNKVGEWGAGATPLRNRHEYYGGDIPWFKSGELSSDFISKSEETVTELALKETSLRYNKVGDVLIAMYGATIGKASILNIPATTNQAVCACTPFSGVYNVYLLHLLKAYNKRFVDMGAGGAQPNISREKIIATVIALPPLNEQHRIAAKVDELMALCDELEQQETNNLMSHKLLVETLLGTLTQAKDAAEFETAWATLAQHFDDLFITEDSIDQLKQAILQLAVMGKLVPQDPKDKPASVLLEKIKKEKERLVDSGKIKKQKPLTEINDESDLSILPGSWEWSKLGEFGILLGGFAYQSSDFKSNGDHQVIRMGNIRPNLLRLEESPAFISDKLAKETIEYKIQTNDVLVTMTGTKGKRDYLYTLVITTEHLNQRELYLNQRLCVIRPIGISSNYINLVTKDNRLLDSMYSQSTGTANQANIGMGTLNNWVLPIPPLEEQNRIVLKVDELFELCDDLKERITESQKIANHMANSILEQVV